MSVKFDKLEVGDILWHTTTYKMGNTSITSTEAISGVVTEINEVARTIKIGGHGGYTIPEARLKGYSLAKPLIVYGAMGSGRKATKEEKQLWQEGKLSKRTNPPK